MTQPNESNPNPQPVSTVTKHIKIYSDNPIHDCIGELIDACEDLDDSDPTSYIALVELREIADKLVQTIETERVKLYRIMREHIDG